MHSKGIQGFNIMKWAMVMMEVKRLKDTSGINDSDSSSDRLVA